MKKVFWGFLLIFVNFNLTLNGHILNLFPTFAGYILLYQAAEFLVLLAQPPSLLVLPEKCLCEKHKTGDKEYQHED